MKEKRVFKLHLINLRVRHYQYTLWLSLGTIAYGISLLVNDENIINRLKFFSKEIFSKEIDSYLGILMIAVASFKIISVLMEFKRLKRISLLGVLASWLIVFWSYLSSTTQNNSWVITGIIIGFCYIALYRGDFSD